MVIDNQPEQPPFDVLVCNRFHWKIRPCESTPPTCDSLKTYYDAIAAFETAYRDKFPSKTIQWHHAASTVNCSIATPKGRRSITLLLSQYAMLSFLDSRGAIIGYTDDSAKRQRVGVPLEELLDHMNMTKMGRDKAKDALTVLCDAKVVKLEIAGYYAINAVFEPKKSMHNLAEVKASTRNPSPKISNEANALVMEDRKIEVHAAIVRTLKLHRTVESIDVLFGEVAKTLRFPLEMKFFRKQVDALKDKEYLKFDEEDKKRIHYIT
jgi:hypothetical protein